MSLAHSAHAAEPGAAPPGSTRPGPALGEAALGKAAGLVGPNAVIQFAAALHAEPGLADRVFRRAGHAHLLAAPPTEMVDERVPAALFGALFAETCPTWADRIARSAGTRTADYVIANRIPGPARALLPRLPQPVATRLLLGAIRRAAWTFAGSGVCTVSARPAAIAIAHNPLAMPGCAWHQAVFAQLFEVLTPQPVAVRHVSCCRAGDPACRFHIEAVR